MLVTQFNEKMYGVMEIEQQQQIPHDVYDMYCRAV